jgi:hypothetical protein
MDTRYLSFAGARCLCSGTLDDVVLATKRYSDAHADAAPPLIFDASTGAQLDFDLRGTERQALGRLATHPHLAPRRKPAGPGRPKLGVVAREVTLLPRHWEWLEEQRGGISASLRSLVEEAMKGGQHRHLARKARDAAGKIMWALAGDLPHFEAASRALYALDGDKLREHSRGWPKDIRNQMESLFERAHKLHLLAELDA